MVEVVSSLCGVSCQPFCCRSWTKSQEAAKRYTARRRRGHSLLSVIFHSFTLPISQRCAVMSRNLATCWREAGDAAAWRGRRREKEEEEEEERGRGGGTRPTVRCTHADGNSLLSDCTTSSSVQMLVVRFNHPSLEKQATRQFNRRSSVNIRMAR